MCSMFFDCVNNSLKQNFSAENFEFDLSESILRNQYQDQIVVVKSKPFKLGIVLEKEQVQFLVTRENSNEWFDLSSITYFLSEGRDDWVFESLDRPLIPKNIESRIDELIAIFQKYEEQIIQLFTANKEFELKKTMHRRWEERRRKLKQKMRFPFFSRNTGD